MACLRDTEYLDQLIQQIDQASHMIDISMFMAQNPEAESAEILDSLVRALRRGVKVRALFESRVGSNYGWAVALRNAGADARLDDHSSKLHDKVVLFDGERMIAGSHNWSNAALSRNRELSVLLVSEPAAFSEWRRRYDEKFEAGEAPRIDSGIQNISRNHTIRSRNSPSTPLFHSVRGRVVVDGDYLLALTDLLEHASAKISVAMYYISPRAISERGELAGMMNLMEARLNAGLAADVTLDQMDIDEEGVALAENEESLRILRSVGITGFFDQSDRTHHVKCVVGDSSIVLVGSHNWTTASTRFNCEISFLAQGNSLAVEIEQYLASIQAGGTSGTGAARDVDIGPSVPMSELIRVHH